MTDQERAFVAAMVDNPDAKEAARAAGYAHPVAAASKLMGRPDVARAVWEATEVRLRGEGAAVGVATLIRIASDPRAPFNAQVAAAGHLVKLNGYGEAVGAQAGAIPLSEMTPGQLAEARVRALAAVARLEAETLDMLPAPEPSGGFFD